MQQRVTSLWLTKSEAIKYKAQGKKCQVVQLKFGGTNMLFLFFFFLYLFTFKLVWTEGTIPH